MILRQKQFKPAEGITNRMMPPVSLSEAIGDLKERGYRYKFRREETCLYCVELGSWFTPDSFTVNEYYHFEDDAGTHGDRMLYAITSKRGLKGFLADTCFSDADSVIPEIIEKPVPEYALTEAF